MTASKELMDDYTPGPVALQGVQALDELFLVEKPSKVLDPSAGSGVFGQVFRQVWPRALTTAVEPKKGEAWYLSCNYDRYSIGTYQDTVLPNDFDVIITNPPFHSWKDFVVKSLLCVRPGGFVALLGLTSWGSRSRAGNSLFDNMPPVGQMRITGAVSYRPQGTDSRDYCWWVFRRKFKESDDQIQLKCWVTLNLPRLESDCRRWPAGRKPGRIYGQEFQTRTEGLVLPPSRERHIPCGFSL